MTRNRPIPSVWTGINAAAAVLAFGLVLGRLLVNHDPNQGWWGYSAGEWLINYGNGFVRRGLGGEIVRSLPTASDLVALELWVGLLSAVVLVLFAVLVQRGMRTTGKAWGLALWLLPSWFLVGPLQSLWHPFWVTSTQFAMRKEQYYLAVVLIAAVWWTGRPPRSAVGWAVSSGVLGVLLLGGVLMHEGLALPAVAALALLGWRASASASPGARATSGVLLLAPAAIGAVSVLLNPGVRADRVPVWQAVDQVTRDWYLSATNRDYAPVFDGVPAAISFLGSDSGRGADVARTIFVENGLWVWWLVTAAAVLGAALVVLILSDRSRSAMRNLTVTVLAVGIASLPLFVIAYDWGRWMVFATNLIVITGLATIVTDPAPRPARAHVVTVTVLVVVLMLAVLVGVQEVGDPRGTVVGWLQR